jgi:hypothetical protein
MKQLVLLFTPFPPFSCFPPDTTTYSIFIEDSYNIYVSAPSQKRFVA